MNTINHNTVYALSLEEALRRTPCSPEPMAMKEFLDPVGRLLGFTSRYVSFQGIVNGWLLQEGYIEMRNADGCQYSYYVLTSRGEEAGLSGMAGEPGKNGMDIWCGLQGKRFLLDSLGQALSFRRRQWEAVEACLTPEFLGSVSCGTEAESPTSFVKRINERLLQLSPDLPRKFSVVCVNTWLVRQGLLEDMPDGKGWKRICTEAGMAEGIAIQRSVLENGRWKKVISNNASYGKGNIVWTQKGKQFILAHLRDIARDLGTGAAYREVPLEFSMTEGLLAGFSYSHKALSYSGVMKMLGAEMWAAAGIRLPGFLVHEWLVEKGFLTEKGRFGNQGSGRAMRVPTERGKAIGLVLIDGKEYAFTAYQEAAQRYIVEHLEEIVAYWQMRYAMTDGQAL